MAEELSELVARALSEDVGSGDVTTDAIVPEGRRAQARIVQKEPGVVFGFAVAREAFSQAGADGWEEAAPEAEWRDQVPADVVRVEGSAQALLAAERTALNFLGRLSGIATLTARFAQEVSGTGATVLDTRKTTPGLRLLEKQAVAAGGGANHRFGLFDAILIKENHIAMAGSVAEAVQRARAARPGDPVEVECRNRAEVEEALAIGAERILLDNMDATALAEAVRLRADHAPQTTLEASGGISLANVREVAETGVDFVSIGALTHSAPSLDVSLLLEPH